MRALALAAALVACGSPRATEAPTVAASASAPASATATATASASASAPAMKATMAMPMEGSLTDKAILGQVNQQIANIGRCAALVRAADSVVGSLNLQITVAADGKVTPDLQSPVAPDAKACILDGIRKWRISGGPAKSMVLLSLE